MLAEVGRRLAAFPTLAQRLAELGLAEPRRILVLPSEVHALSRLSGLIALVARRIRRGASGLTAQQRGEVLSALEAATDGLNHGRVAEFDACIRRLKLALRLLEPD